MRILTFFTLMTLATFFLNALAQDDMDKLLEEISRTNPLNEPVIATFKTTRVVNAHSLETVHNRMLDFRIGHRFGNIAGDYGGFQTLYGFDQVTDIRIAFEYGVNERMTLGFGRSKGATAVRAILDGHIKYRLLWQTDDNKMPLSVTLLTGTSFTTMKRSSDSTSEAFLPKTIHRLSYVTQAIIGRKFSENLSLILLPTYVHRNFVAFGDRNALFAIGVAGRLKFTKRFGIIADYFYVLPQPQMVNDVTYYNPLGIGIEIETGGHVFHLNFTNSTGIIEQQFIPSTSTSWLKGEFRFGFNISRVFQL